VEDPREHVGVRNNDRAGFHVAPVSEFVHSSDSPANDSTPPSSVRGKESPKYRAVQMGNPQLHSGFVRIAQRMRMPADQRHQPCP